MRKTTITLTAIISYTYALSLTYENTAFANSRPETFKFLEAPKTATICQNGLEQGKPVNEEIKQLELKIEALKKKIDMNQFQNGINIPIDEPHCTWSLDGERDFKYHHPALGEYTVCRSRNNSSSFFIQFKESFGSSQICFLSSDMISENYFTNSMGRPVCIYPVEKNIYKLNLESRDSRSMIRSIIIMPNQTQWYTFPFNRFINNLDAFTFCADWYRRSGDDSYCNTLASDGELVFHRL